MFFIAIERIHNYFSASHQVLLEETGNSVFPSNCLEKPACCSDYSVNSGQIKKWPGGKRWSQCHMISLVFTVP